MHLQFMTPSHFEPFSDQRSNLRTKNNNPAEATHVRDEIKLRVGRVDKAAAISNSTFSQYIIQIGNIY